ncbi:MAG TPA: NAD/NADP transhydrogenase alpha subunit-like protein [Azospirillum sp.]
MKSLHNHQDAMGTPVAAIEPSTRRLAVVLAANTPKTVAVPSGARILLLVATGPVWVQYGAAAAVPAADVLDGTAPELNPACRWIAGTASIGLAASAACTVSLCFYA